MSREKQINEMAKFLGNNISCGDCESCDFHTFCYTEQLAISLYEAGYRKIPDNIGEFSDGYHTFNELYHHRAVLFSVICNMFPEKAWKSKLHDTGDMFDGMFIVGIETEQGQATYHYDIEPYWDMFKVKELEKAPKWDGHTPSDAIQRIGSISSNQSEVEEIIGKFECFLCHVTGGRLSKYTYDLRTMETVATDCINETYNDGFGEGYKECAREIFEEIYEDCFDQFGYINYEALAELKKKYTEGNNEKDI